MRLCAISGLKCMTRAEGAETQREDRIPSLHSAVPRHCAIKCRRPLLHQVLSRTLMFCEEINVISMVEGGPVVPLARFRDSVSPW